MEFIEDADRMDLTEEQRNERFFKNEYEKFLLDDGGNT